jgi:hypothetical protein
MHLVRALRSLHISDGKVLGRFPNSCVSVTFAICGLVKVIRMRWRGWIAGVLGTGRRIGTTLAMTPNVIGNIIREVTNIMAVFRVLFGHAPAIVAALCR